MIMRMELVDGAMVPSEREDARIYVYASPDAGERADLRERFGMDEHTVSSVLDPDEVSRLEAAPDHLLMIWKQPTNYSGKGQFLFNVASIGMLLRDERLAIVISGHVPPSLGTRPMVSLRRPLDVMLGVLLVTIQHYLEHLKVIKLIARDLQQKINSSMENKHLIQMFNLSESLIYYLNAINSNGVVLTRLHTYAERNGFASPDLEFIDDLIIENNQCYKQAEIYSTVLSGLMDARGSLVNNNMSVLLKNLTLINVVFLPLNLLASIGGMSEYSMMTRGMDWRMAYLLFFAAMGVIGWITSIFLRRIDPSGGPLGITAKRRPSGPRRPR
jgi:magnesium transporter